MNSKLRIAYGLLVLASLSVVALDAKTRRTVLNGTPHSQFLRPAAPLPITPLAQSLFSAARPDHTAEQDTATACEQCPEWFLTVPMKVDSGTRPVALNRGTRVQLLGEQDGKLLVRRNGTDFLVEKTQLTDDVAIIANAERGSS